jgi:hypothetical protein
MPANGQPYSQAAPTSDADRFKSQFRYNLDDPGFAFNNALQDLGYNPYAANPFIASLRRLAPGMGQAFALNMATQPGSWGQGNTYADIGQNSSTSYGNFLRNAIAGTPQTAAGNNPANQGVYGQMQYARQLMPQAVQSIRQQQQNLAGGGTMDQINPFTEMLAQQMAANNGMGTVALMQNLVSPFMSRNMASAYGQGLQNAQQQALRRYTEPGVDPFAGDIWTYLLGI